MKPKGRIETEARFERLWKQRPEKFDTNRNVMEKERVLRTWDFLKSFSSFKDKIVADLGCGSGVFSLRMQEAGAHVDALDISTLALKNLENQHAIRLVHGFIPHTPLPDNNYDLVLSTQVIEDLPQEEYRLFISELARIVKPDGVVVCSTLIDIDSEDALARFAQLATTEFDIEKWSLSYHRLWIRMRNFFEAPQRLIKAIQNPSIKKEALQERNGMAKKWFDWAASPSKLFLWKMCGWLNSPICALLRWNRPLLIGCEKISRFLWSQQGVSHALFVGKRRPLLPPESKAARLEATIKSRKWE